MTPGIPWRTWTPEAAAELRVGSKVFLAFAAGLPWLVRWSDHQGRFVRVEGRDPYAPFGDHADAYALINAPASAEVGEAERLLPQRLVPRFELTPDESAWR